MRGIPVDNDAVRRRRKARGWSQEQLAAEAGCSTRTIRSTEQGRPVDADTVTRIAEALEVGVEFLLPGRRWASDLPRRRNEELILRYVQAYVGQDVGGLLELHHADAAYKFEVDRLGPLWGAFPGKEQIARHFEFSFTNIPMVDYKQGAFTAVNGLVFERGEAILQPTGSDTPISAYGANEWRIEEGKILCRTIYFDPRTHLESLSPESLQEATLDQA